MKEFQVPPLPASQPVSPTCITGDTCTPAVSNWSRAASMSVTHSWRPCRAPGAVRPVPGNGGMPWIRVIEQREPGGVSWMIRTPGATSWSRSRVKPHFSA